MTEQEKYINALNGLKNADIKIDDEICYPSIKALEKQIAKKPSEPQGVWLNKRCPSCMRTIARSHEGKNYCFDCGQRLDWGNEDAE